MIIDIGLTLLLVFLNGFFVAAEFSIVKVRSSQIELKIRSGHKLAPMAKKLIDHLDAYLSATQLGITLASLGLGWIGESVVSEMIKNIFIYFDVEMTAETIHSIALPVAFITITILHIVFGELAPKSLAIQRSESTALLIAWPLRLFYIIFGPFIWLLNSFANAIIRMLGFHPASEEEERHSEEELRYLLEEGEKSGVIEKNEHEMLENVFDFSDTPVKQIMVPRGKVSGIEITEKNEEVMDKFIEEGYSRMPVYERTIDNIIGVLYAKDMIAMLRHKRLFMVKDIMRPVYLVKEEEKINVLLKQMQHEKRHVAIVIDEFGGTAGLVTLEDIIEEIVGEIQDEFDEEQPIIIKKAEGEYIILAEAIIDDINDELPENLPEDDDYETIGGLIISELGRIPEKMEKISIANYEFSILERTSRSIEKIHAKYIGSDKSDNNA